MKFDVSSTALLSRLQLISRVISSKNTLPILDCFLFRLTGNQLHITASDMETRLETSIEVNNGQGDGTFAISSKILLEPLKELPEQPLAFFINEANMEILIHFQNGKYQCVGEKGDGYPLQKPMGAGAVSFPIDGQVLLNGINRTLFATAEDELRPVMNGIFFDIHPDDLTFVSSDGHKLVRLRNLTVKLPEAASFILPKKPANILKSILGKETETITISFDENTAVISCKSFEMTCRLIDGRYPNYNSVIPKDNPYSVTIDRLALQNALKRVGVFSNLATSLVKLKLSQNKMMVSAQDIDYATSAEEEIVCQYEGSELLIGFKSTFLIEILGSIYSEEVVLQLADPSRAGLILPAENGENEELLMLLMPMMLND